MYFFSFGLSSRGGGGSGGGGSSIQPRPPTRQAAETSANATSELLRNEAREENRGSVECIVCSETVSGFKTCTLKCGHVLHDRCWQRWATDKPSVTCLLGWCKTETEVTAMVGSEAETDADDDEESLADSESEKEERRQSDDDFISNDDEDDGDSNSSYKDDNDDGSDDDDDIDSDDGGYADQDNERR